MPTIALTSQGSQVQSLPPHHDKALEIFEFPGPYLLRSGLTNAALLLLTISAQEPPHGNP